MTPLLSARASRLLLVLAVLFLTLAAKEAKEKEKDASSRALAGIVEDYTRHERETNLLFRVQSGLPVEAFPDLFSQEGFQKEIAFARSIRERLARVDPRALSHEEWISREVIDWQTARQIAGAEHFWVPFNVTPYASPFWPYHDVLTRYTFAAPADLSRYLGLLRQYAQRVRQLQARVEGQRERGILVPREEIGPVAAMLRGFAGTPDANLFAVAPARLAAVSSEESGRFQGEVRKVIAGEVQPALLALAGLLDSEGYRRAAPAGVGRRQYPGGAAAYREEVRLHTTLDVSPKEVHRLGLKEVARLNARLDEVRKRVGFAGTLPEFRRFLKTDPRFFPKTPEEVAERLMAPVRRIEPKIGSWFLRLPKAEYGVRRLDPGLEATMTYGYYRQPTPANPRGEYLFNGSRLDERPLLNAAALIYHELVPGHHFQIALQTENEALPAFRQTLYQNAFVEGWAEYASDLGNEMGLYADPYDLCGRIAMDLFLSTRLVVDTGMNALGWSRQRAIDYMKENTLESETQIQTETLRYAADIPGQALGYKMGSSKIWELRRRAERALGPRFDIRRFHDAVLGSGSLPLQILERHVEWWIGQEKARKL